MLAYPLFYYLPIFIPRSGVDLQHVTHVVGVCLPHLATHIHNLLSSDFLPVTLNCRDTRTFVTGHTDQDIVVLVYKMLHEAGVKKFSRLRCFLYLGVLRDPLLALTG